MQIVGIVCLVAAVIFFAAAAALFSVYRRFEHKPSSVGKVTAHLASAKYQKNKRFGSRLLRPSRAVTVKHWCRGRYGYTVNGKHYEVSYVQFVRKREMPMIVQVVYLKRFPRIACVKNGSDYRDFDVYAQVMALLAFLCLVWSALALY